MDTAITQLLDTTAQPLIPTGNRCPGFRVGDVVRAEICGVTIVGEVVNRRLIAWTKDLDRWVYRLSMEGHPEWSGDRAGFWIDEQAMKAP